MSLRRAGGLRSNDENTMAAPGNNDANADNGPVKSGLTFDKLLSAMATGGAQIDSMATSKTSQAFSKFRPLAPKSTNQALNDPNAEYDEDFDEDEGEYEEEENNVREQQEEQVINIVKHEQQNELDKLGEELNGLKEAFSNETQPKPGENSRETIWKLIMRIFFIVLYFVCCYTSVRVADVHTLTQAVTVTLEEQPHNWDGDTYTEIKDKESMFDFTISLLTKIFEPNKYYEPMTEGYHYLNGYNYFMGMRMTHNKWEGEPNTDFKDAQIPEIVRKRNYNEELTIRLKDIKTGMFNNDELPSDMQINTPYSKNGGYKNLGGYVHYYSSGMTIEEARDQSLKMIRNGMLGDDLLSLVIEAMFWNQNLQSGIVISYQFLINNSGEILSFKDNEGFFLTRYSSSFMMYSRSTCMFLIFLD